MRYLFGARVYILISFPLLDFARLRSSVPILLLFLTGYQMERVDPFEILI